MGLYIDDENGGDALHQPLVRTSRRVAGIVCPARHHRKVSAKSGREQHTAGEVVQAIEAQIDNKGEYQQEAERKEELVEAYAPHKQYIVRQAIRQRV